MEKGFTDPKLSSADIEELTRVATLCRGDVLKMTTLAGSGHPGGSMSSLDMYLLIWCLSDVDPHDPYKADRDRIVVSHGHTAPGVYAVLGRLGFFDVDDAVAHFRQHGSPYEGHVERGIPGIEWATGNLGQGLSAALGFGVAARLHGRNNRLYCLMGDGEQQKGQISEARRFAVKYKFNNLTALVDNNRLQISGAVEKVMPQNIAEDWRADGWTVLEIDGHDYQAIYQGLRQAQSIETPVMLLAHTIMSKGVAFMENDAEWHGKTLPLDQCRAAVTSLGLKDDLDFFIEKRKAPKIKPFAHKPPESAQQPPPGSIATYAAGEKTDNRSGWGDSLMQIASLNEVKMPIAVFDCDLAGSVKTTAFAKKYPDNFFQSGIQEHHTAAMAGACSSDGVLTFFSDFGVFGVGETFNQHRLNDINHAQLKLVCTHVGLDVGEDGKTHQCIDYLGVLRNLYGYRQIIPADPNQTRHAVHYAASHPGNFFIGMGRSKLSLILDDKGQPFFSSSYRFEYGKADIFRQGKDGAILALGSMAERAMRAWEPLRSKGLEVMVVGIATPTALDAKALTAAAQTGLIVTYEDHNVRTGLGSLVAEWLQEHGMSCRLVKLGVQDYCGSGSPEDLFASQGMAVDDLVGLFVKYKTKK